MNINMYPQDSLLTLSGGPATCSVEVLMLSVTSAALGASPGTSVMSTTATSLASPTQDVGWIIDVIHNEE